MNITISVAQTKAAPWEEGFRALLPEAHVSTWKPGDPQADHAIVWSPPQEFLDEQPGLKAMFNIGAGVDAIMKLRLPPQTLVVRLDDAGMSVQ
ncbi:MAG: glyoxylate/hydroxypyruvate reductase A, partial [Hydrogenophaga sp.]|nr:glyoxylate/hydroxypyruvate reductase A [Hydrogenophaga sp.]